MQLYRILAASFFCLMVASSELLAAPYASGVSVSGNTVNYIMNDASDVLELEINGVGGFFAAPDGNAKGAHTYTHGSAITSFAIRADKTEDGFTTGSIGTLARADTGQAYAVPQVTGTPMSSLTDPLNQFNSPRGVGVNQNPNTANFGTVYITNSNAGTVGGRTLTGRGLYALRADQTDAFAYGDAAQQSALFGTASTNTPYKAFVASSGDVYVAGFGDALSGVWQISPDLTANTQVLNGTTGPGPPGTATCGTCLPVGQNHGSVLASYVTGSTAGGDLTLYTLDEDMTTQQLTRANATDPKGVDTNKLWRYNINGASLPYSGMPTAMNSSLIPGFSIIIDLDRGADGKFYLTENRSAPANSTGVFVTDASGAVLWDSRLATAALAPTPSSQFYSTPAGDFNHDGTNNAADYVLWRNENGATGSGLNADANNDTTVDDADYNIWRGGNGLTGGAAEAGFGDLVNDMYSNIFGMAISPDQKWMATLHNNNTIGITPLVSGIPDVANMRAFTTGSATISARDIAFDAAGNIHMVSSGAGRYIVLAPGGHTTATTSWNGSVYSFGITVAGAGGFGVVPEPGTMLLAIASLAMMAGARRRRCS